MKYSKYQNIKIADEQGKWLLTFLFQIHNFYTVEGGGAETLLSRAKNYNLKTCFHKFIIHKITRIYLDFWNLSVFNVVKIIFKYDIFPFSSPNTN